MVMATPEQEELQRIIQDGITKLCRPFHEMDPVVKVRVRVSAEEFLAALPDDYLIARCRGDHGDPS
jgi:excinuclease UvrABC helicase subunit UvrB